jgi:type VI secretion system secreted protein VgrG
MATMAGMASVSFTQSGRPFTVTTPLGADKLLLERFTGEEAVSAPFHFTLEMVSKQNNISADSLVRQPISINMELSDGSTRVIHGRVSRFVQLGSADGLTSYRADMVSWNWFLSLSSDCRIFQHLSAVEIIKKIFDENGFTDYKVSCVKSYPKREYCVQYRESHLDFVSRLMEEEGIFYFFEHSGSKHTLILADAASAVKASISAKAKMASAGKDKPTDDVLDRVELETSARSGKVVLADYNPATPSTQLRSSAAGKHKEEVYDYPGNFLVRDEGDRYARIRLEEREAMQVVVRGEGNVRGLQTGSKFDLVGHYRGDMNKAYMLLRVWHSGSVGSYHAGTDAQATYRTRFIGIPADVPYHPPRVTPKPRVFGSQTAVVVGKGGEEIDVDKNGMVVVQFHWDRTGKKDEKSSCRVRVSSAWAGKGWGFITIPRIGQEVIVDFLEGDPDRPIITGRVYNAEQVPPYPLPASGTQSGIISRSSKSGASDNFNEIWFEDEKGKEEVYIHAEKDKNEVVENDNSEEIGHDETIKVGNDQSITVAKNQTVTVNEDQSISVAKNRSLSVGEAETISVGKDQSLSVGGNRTETVDKNASLAVKGNNKVVVDKDTTEQVKGSFSLSVDKDSAISVKQNHGLAADKKISIKAGDSLTIESDKEILIKTGSASIHMKQSGDIEIKGAKIQVKASGDLILKGSKVAAN